MDFKVKSVPLGKYQANCFIVSSDGEGMIVDPGDNAKRIMRKISGIRIKYIVLTHAHEDHMMAANELAAKLHLPVMMHSNEVVIAKDPRANYSQDQGHPTIIEDPIHTLEEGDVLEFGDCSFEVMYTPGHTPGSICLYSEDRAVLLSGDTLFKGASGGTQFIGSNRKQLRKSLGKIGRLPGDVKVYSGHGGKTRIDDEKRVNEFLI